MARLQHKMAGTLLAGGLLIGGLATAFSPAGAALLPLLTTTTSNVTATQGPSSPTGVPAPVVLSATVSLELLKGALITPSGDVAFTATSNDKGTGIVNVPLGQAKVSSCLLGLPSLLGLYQTTCTATLTSTTAASVVDGCGPFTITASYSGSSDLIAKPSSNTVQFGTDC